MSQQLHHYEIGALLYCPANQTTIVQSILEEKITAPYSLCLCLEDTISDDFVTEAEHSLVQSLCSLYKAKQQGNTCFFPKIYIRVRHPQQIPSLYAQLGEAFALVDGFIAPKITPEALPPYIDALLWTEAQGKKPCYLMPILESHSMIDLRQRGAFLYAVKEAIAPISEKIASLRVGGSDLCHCFHLRRSASTTIHEIPVISNLFSDIIAVFAMDYLVSGAVWEYYSGEDWDGGLKREVFSDRSNGFTGKTVIHPKQIPIVNQGYQVSLTDYQDACLILDPSAFSEKLVGGNATKERMNEVKTHSNWAERTVALATVYGIIE